MYAAAAMFLGAPVPTLIIVNFFAFKGQVRADGAVMKWRYVLGFLPLLLLIVGVVNILMLHSMSSVLQLDEAWHEAGPRHRHHAALQRQKAEGPRLPAASIEPRQSATGSERTGDSLSPRVRTSTARAVIFPASPGDRTTAALVAVLREIRMQPDFCRKDLASCILKHADSTTDLVWLKKEGNIGQIPEQSLVGASAVNSLGLGWKVWSRRSLCIALHTSRKALKQEAGVKSLTSWYPECYTLPLKPAAAARLRGNQEPDGMWVLHGSSTASSAVFPSGVEAAKVTGGGVMQRYISPPLTLQGYKFSLLLYVAVTSVCPLRTFLYRDGHVLLALHPYSEDVQGKDWRQAHSTRIDAHPEHVQRMRGEHGLLKYLAAALRGKTVQGKTVQEPQDLDAERVWASIEDAVGLAILSVVTYVVPRDITTSGDTAEKAGKGLRRFKLLAAHVVLDVNLTPWVIKLDPSPSLPLTALGSAWSTRARRSPARQRTSRRHGWRRRRWCGAGCRNGGKRGGSEGAL